MRRPDDEPWEGVGFATAWGVTFPLTRKLGMLMSDPMAMLEGVGAGDPRVQELRETVLAGRIDRIQSGTIAMEKLFNLQAVESAREYVYHHPEDERFVPADLPEPDLINIKPVGDSSTWTSTVSRCSRRMNTTTRRDIGSGVG